MSPFAAQRGQVIAHLIDGVSGAEQGGRLGAVGESDDGVERDE
jgi:hypothetical protein